MEKGEENAGKMGRTNEHVHHRGLKGICVFLERWFSASVFQISAVRKLSHKHLKKGVEDMQIKLFFKAVCTGEY